MNPRLIEAVADGLKPVIRAAFAAAVQPLLERLAKAEAREPAKGDKGDPGERGADGRAGKDADPALVERTVAEAVAKIPLPKDGQDGTAGRDGADGRDGKDADPAVIDRFVAEAVGKIPPAKDGRDGQPGLPGPAGRDGKDGAAGADGKDGREGLGFDDINVEHDGEGGFVFRFVRGDQIREFGRFQVPRFIDRGVWREGSFRSGDGVTWGGCFYIAQKETSAKPGTSADWRLAVKCGRDGKDGKPGEIGPQGPKGDRGERGIPGYGG